MPFEPDLDFIPHVTMSLITTCNPAVEYYNLILFSKTTSHIFMLLRLLSLCLIYWFNALDLRF